MTCLHVFDLDGTLLRGAASVELSRHLGTFEIADRVERSWLAGEITDLDFWDTMLPLWAHATEADVDQAFAASSWIGGVRHVLADIVDRGEIAVVISQSPHFFVRRLETWGAHRTFGSGVVPGVATTRDVMLTPQHKVDITLALLDEYGLDEDRCVAYGDSTSDVALFDHLTHTVGVNCRDVLRPRAAVTYDGDDLREAYRLGRSLLTADGTRQVS